ncbi:hypothetical protein ANCCAN_25759 [Ancylostoma caninum]|uniref:Uncharacterized protein n=1 Tax=Ancylostoma caninum TaxID=29170 RepID=A0A368FA62_ANCCA|nr:hypothetical protein ANCCAN_25759 [Ancylostoma caninum]
MAQKYSLSVDLSRTACIFLSFQRNRSQIVTVHASDRDEVSNRSDSALVPNKSDFHNNEIRKKSETSDIEMMKLETNAGKSMGDQCFSARRHCKVPALRIFGSLFAFGKHREFGDENSKHRSSVSSSAHDVTSVVNSFSTSACIISTPHGNYLAVICQVAIFETLRFCANYLDKPLNMRTQLEISRILMDVLS